MKRARLTGPDQSSLASLSDG